MKPKPLARTNALSVLVMIGINVIAQLYGINGNSISSLSSEYDNLFTPADYAFSIWPLIFIALVSSVIFQIKGAGKPNPVREIQQMGHWFSLANFMTAAWVIAWLYEYTGLSVLAMFVILYSLIKVILNTDMERWDAPLKILAFIWWPVCLFSGWITVATIANISAWLSKIGWSGAFLTEIQWAMILIIMAVIINLLMVITRNMREFAAVGIWALVAIYIRHHNSIDAIAFTALGGAIILGTAISIHGYKNRKANPLNKLLSKSK